MGKEKTEMSFQEFVAVARPAVARSFDVLKNYGVRQCRLFLVFQEDGSQDIQAFEGVSQCLKGIWLDNVHVNDAEGISVSDYFELYGDIIYPRYLDALEVLA